MNSDIHLVLFWDGTVLRFLSDQEFDQAAHTPGSDEYAVAKMIESNKDPESISEKDGLRIMSEAWGLPPNIFELDTPYVQNIALLQLIRDEMKSKFRIGMVILDKKSAKKALGPDNIELFNDILTHDELEKNLQYTFDSSVHVVENEQVAADLAGFKYIHVYENPEKLRKFLQSPNQHSRYMGVDTSLSDKGAALVHKANQLDEFANSLNYSKLSRKTKALLAAAELLIFSILIYFVTKLAFPDMHETVFGWLNTLLGRVGQ